MGERPVPAGFVPDIVSAPSSPAAPMSGVPRGFVPDVPTSSSATAAQIRQRPLLMGPHDAGIAQQLPNDPQAMQQVRAAQAPGENAGILAGAAALGGIAAAQPLTTALSSGIVKGLGETALYAGAYHAGRALGIPSEVMNALMIVGGGRALARQVMRGGGAQPTEPLPSNAGGRLVQGQAPTLNDVIGDALDALREPESAKMTTLPPQPTLPPGYMPRSSAPQVASPSGMASMQAAAPQAAPPQAAPVAQPTPSAMPSAWQQFAKPASFPPKEIEGSGLAAAFEQELAKRGLPASETIPLVMRNKSLPSDVRAQLVSALEKVARKQAGVAVPSMTEPTLPASWQALVQK